MKRFILALVLGAHRLNLIPLMPQSNERANVRMGALVGSAVSEGVRRFFERGSTVVDKSSMAVAVFTVLVAPKAIIAGNLEGDDLANVDNSQPIVVVTHGILSTGTIGFPEWTSNMADAIQVETGLGSNILKYEWELAKSCNSNPCGIVDVFTSMKAIDPFTPNEGFSLARQLLGAASGFNGIASGDERLHLIGHSAGTHVNAFAALALNTLGVTVDTFTILDRPLGIADVPLLPGPTDDALFKHALQVGMVSNVDNYSAINGTGGDLSFPVPAAYEVTVAGGHSDVPLWYIDTIPAGSASDGFQFSPASDSGTDNPVGWDPSELPEQSNVFAWSGASGDWADSGNWTGGIGIPNNDGESASVLVGSAQHSSGIVKLNHLTIGSNATVSVLDATLTMDGRPEGSSTVGSGVSVSVIENEGTLLVSSSPTTSSQLVVEGVLSLRGAGTLLMSDSANNRILGAGSQGGDWLLNGQGHTIRGAGSVGLGSLGIINGGRIEATSSAPLVIQPDLLSYVLNGGTLAASNGATLVLQSGFIDNTYGEILVEDGSSVELASGARVEGGIIRGIGDGSLIFSGGTVEGVLFDYSAGGPVEIGEFNNTVLEDVGFTSNTTAVLGDGQSARMRGTIENRGEIELNAVSASASLVVDRASDTVWLTGGGVVTLADNPGNSIYGRFQNLAGGQVSDDVSALINVDNTIRGAGTIGAATSSGTGGQQLILVNRAGGLIDATGVNPLNVNLNWLNSEVSDRVDDDNANQGVMQASNGGTLIFGSGAIDNTGGVIQALDVSTVRITNARITGGELVAAGGTVTLGAGSSGQSGEFKDGIVRAEAGSTVELQYDGALVNSVLTTQGDGGFFGQGGQLEDVEIASGTTVEMSDSGLARMRGTIENRGEIELNAVSASASLVVDRASDTVWLTGGGVVTLADNPGNSIYGRFQNLAGGQVSDDVSALINVDNTIRGAGTIGAATSSGTGGQQLILVNRAGGLIDATGVNPLNVNLNWLNSEVSDRVDDDNANQGVMQASNGGTLIFGSGAIDNTGGVIQALDVSTVRITNARITGGELVAAGGTVTLGAGSSGQSGEFKDGIVRAEAGSTVELQYDGALVNSVLTTQGDGGFFGQGGQLEDVEIASGTTVEMSDSGLARMRGTIENRGEIELNAVSASASLVVDRASDTVWLTGGGVVTLADNPGNSIYGRFQNLAGGQVSDDVSALINVDNTIRGAGTIGAATSSGTGGQQLILVNRAGGLIDATGVNPLNVNLNWLNSEVSDRVDDDNANQGVMQASNGGTLIFGSGAIDNTGGVIQALDGSTVMFQGGTATNNTAGILTGGTWRSVSAGGGSSLTISGAPVTQNAATIDLSGAGSAIQIGSIPLEEGLTHNLAAGTLRILDGRSYVNADDFTNDGVLQVGGSLSDTNPDAAGTFTNNEVLSNNGTLTVDSGGMVNGQGTFNQIAGATQVDGSLSQAIINIIGGSLSGTGTIQSTSQPLKISDATVLAPGNSIGQLNFLSDVDFDGILNMEIDGDSSFDVLGVVGTVDFTQGTLDIDLLDGYNPLLGASFDLVTASVILGEFETLLLPNLSNGFVWELQYLEDIFGNTDVLRASVVNAIPVPPAIWLFMSALGLLGWARRNKRLTD